jgi:uncharacterized membrane protein YedE/YeeE
VLGAAVIVATAFFHFELREPCPLLDTRFHLASAKKVDLPLIAGAVLFGIGWGLAGYCPGSAITSIGFANPEALWIVPAMLAGAGLTEMAGKARAIPPHSAPPMEQKTRLRQEFVAPEVAKIGS